MSAEQHIICRNGGASGLNYAVKIPAKIWDKFDYEFLQHHFDFIIATGTADLANEGNGEFIEINRATAQLKARLMPGYTKTIDKLLTNTITEKDKKLLRKHQVQKQKRDKKL
jgi:hypothetical protein